MAVEIKVPDMGESVVEATISRWIKQQGEQVSAGEPVVELETDKINLEVGASQAGVLETILKQAGETVMVGDVLATVAAEGAGAAEAEGGTGAAEPQGVGIAATGQPEAAPAVPYQAAAEAERGEDTEHEQAARSEQQRQVEEPVPYQVAKEAPRGEDTEHAAPGGPVSATPVAMRMAQDLGIDLSRVTPTGAGGRITREDVQAFADKGGTPQTGVPQAKPAAPPAAAQPAQTSQAAQPPARPAAAPSPDGANRRETRERMSRRRQTIARRLVEAQQTAAMLTTFNEIDMSAVMELRKRRREGFKERYGVDLGFMSFFVKATIGALKAFPNVNAEIQGDEIVLKHYYDIGVAIGAEEGLVVPVIRDADTLNFAGIEKAIREFVGKVKEGTLVLEDLRGGTFTITNGGVYGSLMSTPILNPPQVGILGMHAIKERPMVVDGQIVARPMMYVALSYDHRIVDGREAVQFLVRLKELVEDPEALLFG